MHFPGDAPCVLRASRQAVSGSSPRGVGWVGVCVCWGMGITALSWGGTSSPTPLLSPPSPGPSPEASLPQGEGSRPFGGLRRMSPKACRSCPGHSAPHRHAHPLCFLLWGWKERMLLPLWPRCIPVEGGGRERNLFLNTCSDLTSLAPGAPPPRDPHLCPIPAGSPTSFPTLGKDVLQGWGQAAAPSFLAPLHSFQEA